VLDHEQKKNYLLAAILFSTNIITTISPGIKKGSEINSCLFNSLSVKDYQFIMWNIAKGKETLIGIKKNIACLIFISKYGFKAQF